MTKKIIPAISVLALFVFLIFGYFMKDNLNSLISDKMRQETGGGNTVLAEKFINKEYNYKNNGEDFEFTLLEFGSSGCAICKQMEPVLEKIKQSDKFKVKVVFLHIMKPENQDIMKYYGISAVPMQILLDVEGNEFFRHYGFIPVHELLVKLEGN